MYNTPSEDIIFITHLIGTYYNTPSGDTLSGDILFITHVLKGHTV